MLPCLKLLQTLLNIQLFGRKSSITLTGLKLSWREVYTIKAALLFLRTCIWKCFALPMLGVHAYDSEKLKPICSLTEAFSECFVQWHIFTILWVFFWGVVMVVVICNNGWNLFMNLWNLFPQLLYITAGWNLACLFWMKCQHWIFLFWMKMKTNINLSIKLLCFFFFEKHYFSFTEALF